MRSNDGRALQAGDLPAHPCGYFCEWRAITALWSYEYQSEWGKLVRAELQRLGWRRVRIDSMTIAWR